MKLATLLQELDRICPWEYQEDFDNSGLQVGDEDDDCHQVLLAFDFTEAILDEAIEKGCDTIITHHPFLFRGVKSIHTQDWQGKMIYKLIENKVALIAMHTNLDKIDFGVNMKLAADLGLENTRVFLVEESGCGLGAVGTLPAPQKFGDFVQAVKQNLHRPCVKYVGDENKEVMSIGVLGGAGAEFLATARDKGLDVYLSSDFKYHDAQKAQNIDMCIIDAGHFGTEVGVVEALGQKLENELPELEICISKNMNDYWQYK